MKKIALIIIFAGFIQTIYSQSDSSESRITQVTFFYPIGTNGIDAPNYVNNFSFNALYGLNGGVHGFEIGGLVNANTGHVHGAQIAGIANINAAAANGVIIAGIGNFIADSSNSICLAGIANVVGSNLTGMQVAGITNTVNGNVFGGQFAGVTNLSHGDFRGVQSAGIANVNTGNFKGVQAAGISNFNGGDLQGAQFGLINRAKMVKGFQFGLINIADEFESGVPIGLLSYVRNGYHAIELSGGESIYGNLNFKLGVDKFYTIYKLGFTSHGSNQYLTYGFGVGSKINFSDKASLSIDGSSSHVIKQNFNPNLDLLNKVDVSFRYNLGEHFDIFAGPSFNVYLSQHDPETESAALNVPYSLFTHDWGNDEGQTYLWIGANAGISVKF